MEASNVECHSNVSPTIFLYINSQSHKDATMPLRTETTVEYYFDNAYLFYCKTHDCLRVSNNHEDSVLLNGIEQGDVDNFISSYIEYVLEDANLKDAFKASVKRQLSKDVEKIDE